MTLNQRPDYGLLITQDGGSHERKESPPFDARCCELIPRLKKVIDLFRGCFYM